MTMSAQSFDALWKQVEQARQKDLPKTQINLLDKIERTKGKNIRAVAGSKSSVFTAENQYFARFIGGGNKQSEGTGKGSRAEE